MTPEPKKDCLLCNEDYQHDFLSEFREMRAMLSRLTYLAILTIGILVGLGVIQFRDALALQPMVDIVAGPVVTVWTMMGG